jgi:hypothetical protein
MWTFFPSYAEKVHSYYSLSNSLKIRFTEHLPVESYDKRDDLLDKPVGTRGCFFLRKEKKDGTLIYTNALTAREWDELRWNQGWYPYTTFDEVMAYRFREILGPLELLGNARPASKSFVKDLRFDKVALTELPIEFISWESIDTNLLYFTDVFADARIIDADETTIAFMSGPHKNIEEYGMTAEEELEGLGENKVVLTILAWADFNNDGLEDVLIEYYRHHSIGTSSYMTHMILTRKSKKGRLEELELKL